MNICSRVLPLIYFSVCSEVVTFVPRQLTVIVSVGLSYSAILICLAKMIFFLSIFALKAVKASELSSIAALFY